MTTTKVRESIRILWKGMPMSRWRELGRPKPQTSSALWFSQDFLFHPHQGWTVDLDALNDDAIAASLAAEQDGRERSDDPRIYAGVLIRHTCGAVYRLTGVADEEGLYEGVWPD